GLAQVQHDLGASLLVEAKELLAIGVTDSPKFAVGCQGQPLDAGEGEGLKSSRRRVEDLHAPTGRQVQAGASRIGDKAQADFVIEGLQYLAGSGVQQYEW